MAEGSAASTLSSGPVPSVYDRAAWHSGWSAVCASRTSQAGRFAGVAQPAVEALEHRIVLDGYEGDHVERRPDFDRASAAC